MIPAIFFFTGSPSREDQGLSTSLWVPWSSARGLKWTLSPGLALFKRTFLSPREGGGSGVAQRPEVAAGLTMSLGLLLWIWLRAFFDARLNSAPICLLLSCLSGERSFLCGALRGEDGDPTKEENAVVTCWKTSSCLNRSEGDREDSYPLMHLLPKGETRSTLLKIAKKLCSLAFVNFFLYGQTAQTSKFIQHLRMQKCLIYFYHLF